MAVPAVHVAAGDRAARRRGSTRRSGSTSPVRVARPRTRWVPSMRFQPRLAPRPASKPSGGREAVDLLPLVLADVGDPQVAGRRGRRRTATGCGRRRARSRARRPRRRRTGCRGMRVGGSSSVAALGVDAQDLAEQGRRVLPVAVGVAAAAAVAQADVEEAVGAEGELAAVVVGGRLVDRRAARRRVVGVDGGAVAQRRTRATRVRPSGCGVWSRRRAAAVAGEGQAEQPLLAAR